jgi:hypothetical protein
VQLTQGQATTRQTSIHSRIIEGQNTTGRLGRMQFVPQGSQMRRQSARAAEFAPKRAGFLKPTRFVSVVFGDVDCGAHGYVRYLF